MKLEELKHLLTVNEALLQQALIRGSFREITDLMMHRTLLKDSIIEILENQLEATRKAA